MAADPPPSDFPADVLLAAAFAPELAALEPWLGGALEGRVGDVRVAARVVGVGLAAAAAGAALSVHRTQARSVILLGTCGAYAGSGLALHDVVVSRRVELADPTVLVGAMQFPPPMQTRVDGHEPLCDALVRCGARPADIATTLAITVDDAVAELVGSRSRACAEHLEAFAVAIACAFANVPFAALLGVANTVGSRGRDEWREHHHCAAAQAVEIAVRWIREGAQGSPAERR